MSMKNILDHCTLTLIFTHFSNSASDVTHSVIRPTGHDRMSKM